ncbi:MAG: DUF4040 domain-containing protein [Sphaerochaetaceae bacterium]|nr:DUF4040 domain-containing protein [Sphaerochaetaceae bacterium]
METTLLIMLIGLASCALLSKDLLSGIIALGAFSLFSAVIFLLSHAPDVAITEAAVGAGLTTIIFVWAIRHTGRDDR